MAALAASSESPWLNVAPENSGDVIKLEQMSFSLPLAFVSLRTNTAGFAVYLIFGSGRLGTSFGLPPHLIP